MNKFIAPLIIFVLISVVLGAGFFIENKKVLTNTLVGKHTPYFKLQELTDLNKMVSTDQLKGQVSVINFWAEWCLACKVEMPDLIAFAKLPGVKLYGINFKDDYNAALQFLKEYGNPFLFNAYDKEGITGIDFGISAVPETFVLDKTGKIVYRHTGPITTKSGKKMLKVIKHYSQVKLPDSK